MNGVNQEIQKAALRIIKKAATEALSEKGLIPQAAQVIESQLANLKQTLGETKATPAKGAP